MQLPQKLLESLETVKGFNKDAFEKVHASGGQVTSIRVNPAKASMGNGEWSIGDNIHHSPFTIDNKIQWTSYGYYLSQRPSFTFDPLFHAGCYYVQEASSMFLEQALKQTVDLSKPLKVLDLCAAPGGKSTHIQSLISKESLLVSNEVIRSRSNILRDNIIKWGCDNVIVTNNDPKDFAKLENYFDVIVVDAPCSGSGLFRKEPDAIEEWSINNVQLCSQRQQRILADVWPSLKKNGILIYSTCSYSKEEDEEIADWLMKELPIAIPIAIGSPLTIDNWGIIETENGYRFWPDKLKGEGFFISCFRKTNEEQESYFKIKFKPELANRKEKELIEKWASEDSYQFVKRSGIVYGIREKFIADINLLSEKLNVQYFGIAIGELIRDKLIPHHALALSPIVSNNIPKIELNYDKAIEYLKKKELKIEAKDKGWHLVNYQGYNLGWVNVLTNRINNYYPKELRILKDS